MRGGKREGAVRKSGSVARIDVEARHRALAGGMTPLECLLSIMRDEKARTRERLDAAKVAAPFCHARLASTELTGPDRGAIKVEEITDAQRARALAAFIAKMQALETIKGTSSG